MWQPLTKWIDGQGHESYSDQKIIRKCGVTCDAGRVDTPLVVFCHGDGYIIEQCNFGYVAILAGRGGVITGCLNTKYFLFNTSVNIVDAYFEIGQFEILNSQVKFSSGHIQCENNIPQGPYGEWGRRYFGPWFAIDMEFSKIRLRHLLYDLHVNCNDVFWEKNNDGKYYKYAKQLRHSTVEFDPSITCETIYWGYRQPMSGPLFVKGENARIIGMENFESVQRVFVWSNNPTAPVFIPLVNNKFASWNTEIIIPETMRMDIYENQNYYPEGSYEITGSLWSENESTRNTVNPDPNPPIPAPDPVPVPTPDGTAWSSISAFIEIDAKRRLRSRVLIDSTTIRYLTNGAFPVVDISADFANDEYENLKVVLRSSFNMRLYEARIHFKRNDYVSEVAMETDSDDIINNVIFKTTIVPIAGFNIMQAVIPSENDFKDTDFDLAKYQTYGYDQPGVKYKHTYGNFEYIGDDTTRDNYTECSRLVPLNEVNVRAYVNQIPNYGEWAEGDEIVVTYDDGGREWFIYRNGYWMDY